MKRQDLFPLLQGTLAEWSEDKASRLAAALAYYTTFSIAPFLVIVIAIAGLVLGQDAVQGRIVDQIASFIGRESAIAIEAMIGAARDRSEGIIATVLGIGTLIFGASGVFGQLQDALNTMWGVRPKEDRGVVGTIKDRFVSFTMVLGIGFLLLVSFVLSAAISAVDQFIVNLMPSLIVVLQVMNFVLSLGVITLLFAMIYKILPDVEIAWGDVWIGALITAVLFLVGEFAISEYLGSKGIVDSIGAAGALVLFLLWIYYSTQILFLGAEFTFVYANKFGSKVVPDDGAVAVAVEVVEAEEPKGKPKPSGTVTVAPSAELIASPSVHNPVYQQGADVPLYVFLASLITFVLGLFTGLGIGGKR